jgi:hypothetical protein
MHYFSLYYVTTPVDVSGPFIAHHQEAEYIMWRMVGTCFASESFAGGPG